MIQSLEIEDSLRRQQQHTVDEFSLNMRRRNLMNVHDSSYSSSRFPEPCSHCNLDRPAKYCFCSLQSSRNEETHFLDSIPFYSSRKSRCIPLRNEAQADIFVKEMELKTQRMAQLVNKSISTGSNDFVLSEFSMSNSYSTANDSSDDYFLSTTFEDEIDDELDSSRDQFDGELIPTVHGNGRNRIDSKSHSASEDDEEVMFYFEP